MGEAEEASDVFLFSHGWNNDWAAAASQYGRFITSYLTLRRREWPRPGRDYRPLLAGVHWPSTALVAPWERGPKIAGAVERSGSVIDEVTALGESLGVKDRQRLYDLADRDRLDDVRARDLAELLAPLLADEGQDELGRAGVSGADDLLGIWARLSRPPVSSSGGFIDEPTDQPVEETPFPAPTVAGGLGWLDPRNAVRVATVLLMKDRAGVVGSRGVADLLAALCRTQARIHLIGHSYGAKVILSALCAPSSVPRPVDSVLLLQPAVSCYCFATKVAGDDHPGGYHAAVERCVQPIVTTFSRKDVPLTSLFHWAVRRRSDLGEVRIAGVPSRYAALGGYGPQGREDETAVIQPVAPPERYAFGKPIVAIQADEMIGGHGDVTGEACAWALLNQVMHDG
ncbi:hypothetical protein [Nonomuraea sp. NPDC049709]|uniref:hypothetical protein n=1 Tax=Nonomuraea sp. NPDC049709 TaxID=3154736 RepID=UPI003412503F